MHKSPSTKPSKALVGLPKALTQSSDEKRLDEMLKLAKRKIIARELDQAEVILKEAEAIDPNSVKLKNTLASLYMRQSRNDLAAVSLLQILQLDPNDTMAYSNLGAIMTDWKDRDGALKLYEKALDCDPMNGTAAVSYVHNCLYLCNWEKWDTFETYFRLFHKRIPNMEPGLFLPMIDDAALQKKKSESYSRDQLGDAPQKRPKPRVRTEGDKIRIGYFSCDFHDHATMRLMIRAFELHNRDRFEIFIYNYGTKADAMTERFVPLVDRHHVCTKMTDAEIVALARADGIDIAVDLKGYTSKHRTSIVYKNPAPVTVSYLGYPGTLGRRELDYIVADDVMIPTRLRKFYSEKIIYMPDCYQVTDDTRPLIVDMPSRAELGLPEDAFVFASFNSHYKITPREFDIWMRLLAQVDNSVLWIWCREDTARANLIKEAEKRGIAADRLVFADSVDNNVHMARIGRADLFLDTFAVCAHTTASDALWAGLPIITLEGTQFAARVASSILQATNLPELVAETREEYEALALELAQDPQKLQAVRDKIVENRKTAPMFDTERFTRNWENQLERALVRCESGLQPDHLTL